MKIVFLMEIFPKNMGYAGSMLPKYLARSGAEVHVVAMDLPLYYQISGFNETYGKFIDISSLIPGSVEEYDGYKIHILGHKKLFGYMKMIGLREKLRTIHPHIVQTFTTVGHLALDAALAKPLLGFKFFTGNHTTASVFPLAKSKLPAWRKERMYNTLTRKLPGVFVSLFAEKCYGATKDCAEVAVQFFGVPKRKIDICPLGVDTDIFWPMNRAEHQQKRIEIRRKFGFSNDEIICIYTGRFSEDKNPLLLAKALAHLMIRGEPFRGLFFGNGVQADAIRKVPGCVVNPFVTVSELGDLYRSADIGVWPTQESTSMLDAAACGLPIIVNDTLVAVERIEGNGITYKLNDIDDMVRALLNLRDPNERMRLGSFGAQKMLRHYSWEGLAKQRLGDYESALRHSGATS
jgi:glycosyltransferase involved in cell wall biosynthesis